jgi:hypothetical protein
LMVVFSVAITAYLLAGAEFTIEALLRETGLLAPVP